MEAGQPELELVFHYGMLVLKVGNLTYCAKKEILPFTTIWINLENFVLSAISQAQREKCCVNLAVKRREAERGNRLHSSLRPAGGG